MRRQRYSLPLVALTTFVFIDLPLFQHGTPIILIHRVGKISNTGVVILSKLFGTEGVDAEEEGVDVDWFVKDDTRFIRVNVSKGISGDFDALRDCFASLGGIVAEVVLGADGRWALWEGGSALAGIPVER